MNSNGFLSSLLSPSEMDEYKKRQYLSGEGAFANSQMSQGEIDEYLGGSPQQSDSIPQPYANVTGAGSGQRAEASGVHAIPPQVAQAPSAQKVGSSDGWLSKLLAAANTDETPEEKAAREKTAAAGNILTNPSGDRALKLKQMSENFTNYAREMKNQAIARESVDKGRQFDAAASGPAMLAMIQSMGKRDQENRFRTNGLSAMAGI